LHSVIFGNHRTDFSFCFLQLSTINELLNMAKDKTPSDVSKMIKDHGVKLVDFKFTDLPGTWQHFTTTLTEYNEDIFTDGLGFDGSSIRGWKVINASDMLVIPDPATAWIDVFQRRTHPEPHLHHRRSDHSRTVRSRSARCCRKSRGLPQIDWNRRHGVHWPEAEFFIFDDVRFANSGNAASYVVDSVEGHWNSAREEFPNLGYKIRPKEGYFPVSPMDTLQDIRNEMCLELEKAGVAIERQHHEVATAGQAEIDIRYAPLKRMGDNMQYYKYILRNVAKRHNRTVTFMPKPIFGDNGSGMHTHISLWKDDKPLFAGNGYAGLSDTALFFIGGILKHAPALTCLTNPTTNSYKRLVPGFEAPVNLAYSARNRSAAIRIPTYSPSPKAKRIEFRTPDAAANPYLASRRCFLRGSTESKTAWTPAIRSDKNLYELPPEELAQVASVPDSLRGAIEALQADHSFLLRGDVFNENFIANWIDMKQKEYDALRLRPHPYEFAMYYDV
jgi:glutamine synthetase